MGVRGKLEAVIYAAEEPVTLAQLAALFGEEALAEVRTQAPVEISAGNVTPAPDAPDPEREARAHGRAARACIEALLGELIREYAANDRGMEIREIAGGYQVATRPEYHDAVRAFARHLKPPMKLSLPALETLAVIAYKQPVTAPEVSEIRGVDSGGVLGSLIGRKLVTTAGRKQVIGRPILYKTTREFLLRFGLKDLAELPSMEEFEKMASELESLNDEFNEPQPAMKTPEAAEKEAETLPETPPTGEMPRLAPSQITMTHEDAPPEGISVNKSGIGITDPVRKADS